MAEKKTATIAARDLRPGHVIDARDTAADATDGRWVGVGKVDETISPGTVFVSDFRGRHLTVFNHGDPVTIQLQER